VHLIRDVISEAISKAICEAIREATNGNQHAISMQATSSKVVSVVLSA
jgi:hypothetical protein